MHVIGLTGPMGAGKSVVLDLMRELGAECLRADDASRELLARNCCLLAEVREQLGRELFRPDGSLDRGRTAALIFADPEARRALERIVHPPMVAWLAQRLEELRSRRPSPCAVVLEAAILDHMGARGLVDRTVRVWAPPEVCVRRLMARDGISQEEAQRRVSVHQELGLFEGAADHVVDTTGTLEETRRQVRELWDQVVGP